MNYDPVFDKWHEECGVFGVYDRTIDVARYVYWGLFALQHRGQESAGIAVTDGHDVELKKGMGLLTEAIKELPSLPSHMGTGHVRYSTTGEKLDKDRFRRDLGNIEEAYKEMLFRLTGERA